MILVPLLNPKFATVPSAKSCELRVRGTRSKRTSARLPRFTLPCRLPAGEEGIAPGGGSMRQRTRAPLDLPRARTAAHAVLGEPRRAVAVGAPQAAALPAAVRVVDARVEPLGVEAHRVGDAQRDHLAVLERDEAVAQVGGRVGHVGAEADRVVLVDPGVVARLRAVVAEPVEA